MKACRQLLAVSFAIALWCGPVVAASTEADKTDSCANNSVRQCLESTQCDLVQVSAHGKYECRVAVGRCAIGFRQGGEGDIRKECETKSGCRFVYASCFCPPDVECACGGGPPAQCVEALPAARK